MCRNFTCLLWLAFITLATISCKPSWTTAISHGETAEGPFIDTIKTDVLIGLHIVPVKIAGSTYRFLFDTGALFSISEEIQKKMNYKIISTGSLTDSDNTRKKVNYVSVDSILIGAIPFTEHTAFVADFTANPIIKCLEIDGIIGSNLMRHCHWTIDYQNKEIIVFKDTSFQLPQNTVSLPFTVNKQFDQIVNLKFGKATLKKLKIDYGSNGSLTLSKNAMQVLKENEIITETFSENGFVSSGLHGNVSRSSREYAWADTLRNTNFSVEGVELKSGKSGLIGSEILSRFVVTLNFKKKEAHFIPVDDSAPDYSTFGFGIGYSEEKQFHIQSVVANSPADEAGLTPGLSVIRIDNTDFRTETTFCDYVLQERKNRKKLELVYLDESEQMKSIILEKRFIY